MNEISNLSPIEVAVLQGLDQSPSPCVSLGDREEELAQIWDIFTGPWRSEWTTSHVEESTVVDEGKGLACILPERQGSQIGSGALEESSLIPVAIWW